MAKRGHNRQSELHDPASAESRRRFADAGIASTRDLDGDPMSDVLESIHLQGALFFLWQPSLPFGVGVADGRELSRHIVPGTDCIVSYHVVIKGPCWATVENEPPLRLESGDILLLPHGDAYKISDTPQYPTAEDARNSIDFFKAMAAGEIPPIVGEQSTPAAASRLICGFLGCDTRPFNPLLSTLPPMIRVPPPDGGKDPLSPLIEFAMSETRAARGGERCLLMRLSELMFVEVLRRYLRECGQPGSGWLDGLRHPVVGRALALMHRDFDQSWTLQSLAQSIGTSRSTLAERFTEFVGIPPMQYLAQWRMQIAANRLRDPTVKVYAAAREVGYDSEAAFSRAFKRIVGISATAWRERP